MDVEIQTSIREYLFVANGDPKEAAMLRLQMEEQLRAAMQTEEVPREKLGGKNQIVVPPM